MNNNTTLHRQKTSKRATSTAKGQPSILLLYNIIISMNSWLDATAFLSFFLHTTSCQINFSLLLRFLFSCWALEKEDSWG